MNIRRNIATILCLLLTAVGAAAQAQALEFRVNPDWPQLPLGDNWLTGGLGGICVDDRDHVYLLNRQNVVEDDLDGARLAPPIIELNPAGEVVRGWGDPELLGGRLHDCHADAEGNLWIVAAATGHIQKYDPADGSLQLQVGESGLFDSSDGSRQGQPLNSDSAQFFLPSAIDTDGNGDIYVADGELPGGNARIAVLDREGNFLRQWRLRRDPGEADIIELPHCIRVSDDGLVYVCDRRADRIQVFNRQGEFVRNISVGFSPMSDPAGRASGARGNCRCTRLFARTRNNTTYMSSTRTASWSTCSTATPAKNWRVSAPDPDAIRGSSNCPTASPWIPAETFTSPNRKGGACNNSFP